jgi:peptidyl-prolyl cis-trans isomerase SurA
MNIRGFSFKYAQFAVISSLVLALFMVSSTHAEIVDRVEAIVNKKAIYKSDIDQFKRLLPLRSKVDPLFNNDPIAKNSNPSENEIVNFLIDEMIISDKFPSADAEVEQEINGIQSNLHIDREQLRAAIAREGFKFDEYFKLMKVSLAKRQLIDREIRTKAVVSDDDLKAEYNRSRSGSKTFQGSFQIHLIQIPKARFKTPKLAREEAENALADLGKAASFESVAKKYNDEGSDGDLGYLGYSEMFPALQKEVQKLGPQKTSGIFDDGKSLFIVKVSEVKATEDVGHSKEKEALRAKLLQQEFQHQIQLWLGRQRTQNYIKINAKKP